MTTKKPDIDPFTEEGLEEFKARVKKREKELERLRQLSLVNVDAEPTGKLTCPNEMDRHRDHKDED